jgi:hypothetical protein
MLDTKTLEAKIAEDNLQADVSRGNRGEHPVSAQPMNPWTVVLTLGQRTMAIAWWTGMAQANEPTAQDVLEHLLMDATSVTSSQTVQDWCVDYGLSPESRQAERLYHTKERQTAKLREFLGEKYDSYLATWAATEVASLRALAARYEQQHDGDNWVRVWSPAGRS